LPRKKVIKDLTDAPAGAEFQVYQGPVLKNLADLRDALGNITNEQFFHHVAPSEGRNDFANWVLQVFKEWHLAEKLDRRWTRRQAQDTVDRHLKAYYRGFMPQEGNTYA